MTVENKFSAFCILMLINNQKLTPKAMALFEKADLPIRFQFAAHGTANSDMMDILGLGGIEKDVLTTVLPKRVADELLKKLFDELELSQKNTGIAYTIPLSGMSGLFMRLTEKKMSEAENSNNSMEMENMSEMKYCLIAVSVNQGYSENVMNAARSAGARGGTGFHNNSILNSDAAGVFGAGFDEEKETVLIITENDKKLDIMKAISNLCGIQTEAKGVVLSIPIDNIMGLNS